VRKLGQDAKRIAALKAAVAPFSIGFHESGPDVDLVGDKPAIVFVEHLAERFATQSGQHGTIPDAEAFQSMIDEALDDVLRHELSLRLEGVLQPIRPYSMAQLAFLYDLIDRRCPLVFGVGPTGTGKTYLAVATAINQLETGAVKHVVITKPHEMLHGERMTAEKRAEKELDEQFEVYYDILNDLMGPDTIQSLIDERHLSIVPLGLLRGRVLRDSFILVDEAQNADKHWMRLAVTRAGQNSRTIVTGNPVQSNLPSGEMSGLAHLLKLIEGRDLARVHTFRPNDVVRNDTVAKIEALYAQAGETDLDLALQRD